MIAAVGSSSSKLEVSDLCSFFSISSLTLSVHELPSCLIVVVDRWCQSDIIILYVQLPCQSAWLSRPAPLRFPALSLSAPTGRVSSKLTARSRHNGGTFVTAVDGGVCASTSTDAQRPPRLDSRTILWCKEDLPVGALSCMAESAAMGRRARGGSHGAAVSRAFAYERRRRHLCAVGICKATRPPTSCGGWQCALFPSLRAASRAPGIPLITGGDGERWEARKPWESWECTWLLRSHHCGVGDRYGVPAVLP